MENEERETGNWTWGMGSRKRGTENGETGTRNEEQGTGDGGRGTGDRGRGTGNGERGTGNGERGTGNGERGTGNGERGTGNGERGTRQNATLILQFHFKIHFSDLFSVENSIAETKSNNLYKKRTVDWIHYNIILP